MYTDQQLQNLLTQLHRQEPPLPPLVRRKLLSRLLLHIQMSPGLRWDAHQDYAYALNQTLQWVCRSIGEFDPEQVTAGNETISLSEALIRWVNGQLKYRILDLKRTRFLGPKEYRNERTDRDYQLFLKVGLRPLELDRPLADDQGSETTQGTITADPRLGEMGLLDSFIGRLQQTQKQRLGQAIRRYLATDPQGLLQACSPRKFPACHCQELVRRVHLTEPPETLRQIASEFGLPEQTLFSHWRLKCLPLLRILALRQDPQVRDYAQTDPEHRLRECYPADLAACSCWRLAQRLLLSEPPVTLGVVAKELGVKESFVADHWQTQCLPLLKAQRL